MPRHYTLFAMPAIVVMLVTAGVVPPRQALGWRPSRAQAPATWRLTHIGTDTVPLVLRNKDGRALLTILRETLTIGPGDRVLRVTTMHVDAYDRFPCDMLKELRTRQHAGAAGGAAGAGVSSGSAAARVDTTAAECEAMRTGTDSLAGALVDEGGRRVVTWAPAAAGTTRVEQRAVVEQKGDVLELRPEPAPGDSTPVVPLRYRRAGR